MKSMEDISRELDELDADTRALTRGVEELEAMQLEDLRRRIARGEFVARHLEQVRARVAELEGRLAAREPVACEKSS